MDSPRFAVRLSVLAVVAVLGAMLVASVLTSPPASAGPVTQRDGGAFVLPREPGVYEAAWRGEPVLVYVTTQARLAGVEAARGPREATDAVPVSAQLAVFATSARSNFNGCTGVHQTSLGASKDILDYDGDGALDGRFFDVCHHGQWDVFHRGAPVPGTPTCGRLAMLRIALDGDGLVATGFDGPVGAQRGTARC